MQRKMICLVGMTLLLLQVGCAHTHLRYNTVGQARTVADLHTQQVLDNLAKFKANPNAMPHFTFANASASNVSDSIPLTQGFNFSPSKLTGWSLNSGVSRGAEESFTTTPITDPRKLELMASAYRRALGVCCCESCVNPEKLFNSFYLGRPEPEQVQRVTTDGYKVERMTFEKEGEKVDHLVYQKKDGNYYFLKDGKLVSKRTDEVEDVVTVKDINFVASESGKTTINCIDGQCWVEEIARRDAVKALKKPCKRVGHHCGKFVCVPECHTDQLTNLTLVILDIAQNAPPEAPAQETMQVEVSLDKTGAPTEKAGDKVYKVNLTVPTDTVVTELFTGKKTSRAYIKSFTDDPDGPQKMRPMRLPQTNRSRDDSRDPGYLEFRQRLDALAPPSNR